MTTDEVKTVVKKHRSAAIVGGVAGLLLLLGWVGFDMVMTPSLPSVHTADAAEIVRFVSNSRGMAGLTDIEQRRFLESWRDSVMKDEAKKNTLRECIGNLDDAERKEFASAVFQLFKQMFVADAKQYDSLPQEERFPYLRARIEEFDKHGPFVKDVAVGFDRDFGQPDELKGWILEHTTAEEREIGQSYALALEKARQQIRKERRAQQADQTAKSG